MLGVKFSLAYNGNYALEIGGFWHAGKHRMVFCRSAALYDAE
jgi:hypothetical protein